MVEKIIKRDNRRRAFNKDKIVNAILGAFRDVDGEETEFAKAKAKEIANYVEALDRKSIKVEEVQDIIEQKLMASSRKDVAKQYILYRNQRTAIREQKSEFFQVVDEKIRATNVQNQNANLDEASFGGRMGEANSALMKKYALDKLLSPMAKANHLNNEIYIHDLDQYAIGSHNCLSIPFDKLLKTGFNTRQTDVRPANSANTAFQLLAVIFQLQSLQQFGGVSATHLDWTMVPYVRKSFRKHFKDGVRYIDKSLDNTIIDTWGESEDMSIEDSRYKALESVYQYAMDMTIREVYQAVEGMYHNLNTLQSRSGNQLNTRWLAA